MQEALYEGKYFDLKVYLEPKSDVNAEIELLRKRADKGAFCCPYCYETLILKSGEIREEHFAHRHSKSCEISAASEVYHKQIKRESKKHSVIKDIIYDELKVQEKVKKDLDVGYGFVKKGAEKWSYYPDIIVKTKNKELAITVLTDVTYNKDEKLVKQIKHRNNYFKNKGLEPIWFIENAEQSIDMDHRVIHLWEAELDLAMKTPEDVAWEEILQQVSWKQSIFELFSYYHRKSHTYYDVQSLYYVYSTDTNIEFTVQRFIKDEEQYPFRAFALNEGYQISLSTALLATQSLQLSEPEIEKQQRDSFVQTVKQKEAEYIAKQQEKQREWMSKTLPYTGKSVSSRIEKNTTQVSRIASESRKISTAILFKKNDLRTIILDYVQNFDTISAAEISEYLVKNGASSERFSTGRFKIYADVCFCLDSLAKDGIVEFVKKDFVNDRIYTVRSVF